MLFSTFPIFLSLPLSHNSLLGEDFLAFIFSPAILLYCWNAYLFL